MSFALEEARLWGHVEETVVSPPRLKPKNDDSEDRMEKIFAREEKICELQDNTRKAVAKIGEIFTNTIHKGFRLVKASKEWTFQDLWKHLMPQYTLQNSASKWNN